jgi:hypothetical protein
MEIYAQLVHEYNLKQFTYPEDVLAAFAGITASLTRSFKGGFLCGLPEMVFDFAEESNKFVSRTSERLRKKG